MDRQDKQILAAFAAFVALNLLFSLAAPQIGGAIEATGLTPEAPLHVAEPVQLPPEPPLPEIAELGLRNTHLPETPQPTIAYGPELPIARAAPFPPLRLYTGERWHGPPTEVRAATDGQVLLLRFFCTEPDMADRVTEYERPFLNDSVELFLRPEGERYFQAMVDINAASELLTMLPDWQTTPWELPADAVSVRDHAQGWSVTLRVPLPAIGMQRLRPGDTLRMQVARNYRGQGLWCSAELQLFPNHVYAANDGLSHHHAAAHRPLRVAPPPAD